MKEQSTKSLHVAIIAGIIAPILFVGIFIVEGYLRPNYSFIGMYISALSIGPTGFAQVANFLISGLLLFLFARVVGIKYKAKKVSQTGPILIAIFAACLFFSGPFVMDPMGTSPSHATVHGTIHGILGGIAFLIMPISCFVFWNRFRPEPAWSSFRRWTLWMAILISTTLALFIFGTKFPIGQNIFHNWVGLLQRMVLIPYMVWLFSFALAFNKKLNSRLV